MVNQNQIRWLLDNPDDLIQKQLTEGIWYEQHHLDVMQQYCPKNSIILDIGANVGNHTVYFSKFFTPEKVYSIEPVSKIYRMLLANIALNYCHNVNIDYVGLALGDRNCIGYPFTIYGKNNLGSTRLYSEPVESEYKELLHDPVSVVKGDDIFENINVGFIKMDIEGMEMVALDGLEKTISRCRPPIFIEIINDNQVDFRNWLQKNQYFSVYQDVYPDTTNYMLVHRSYN